MGKVVSKLTHDSDESEIASVYAAGPEDVDKAVAAARKGGLPLSDCV
jgi:acyl-CoA reductase-like NAD-dependent aldehyde dehydrogenase